MDSTIPLILKSKISSSWSFSVTALVGLCQIWSGSQIVGFLMQQLILFSHFAAGKQDMTFLRSLTNYLTFLHHCISTILSGKIFHAKFFFFKMFIAFVSFYNLSLLRLQFEIRNIKIQHVRDLFFRIHKKKIIQAKSLT